MRNQFFQMIIKDGQASLKIIPPQDEGRLLVIGEITSYLDRKGFKDYNLVEISKAINEREKESVIFLGEWVGPAVKEMMDIDISLDKMKVICRFYPPSEGGAQLTAKDIVDDLAFHKVRFGIDQNAIFSFLQDRQYCTDYLFAVGQAPIHGKDAKIEYNFNTSKNLQPKRNEDGSVDYKDLNTISHIHAGDLLARLIPADLGTPGKNVFGEEIRPRTVKTDKLSFGNNITLSEDGLEITSDVTGHATLLNGKVFVSNVFEVPADVDNSTGNIEYEGSVLVRGNVKSGFSVRASGDVIVEGVVEGADVTAGAQLIIKCGVHGMFKANLQAGTNLMAKFIENATITVGGYVEAEQILNSDVSAKGTVQVHGRKGLINGGVIRAGEFIDADTIGTNMGTSTNLEVGVDPERKERFIGLSKQAEKIQKDMEDDKVILANYTAILRKGQKLPTDKMAYVQKLAVKLKSEQEMLAPIKEEMSKIYSEMMASNRSYVIVRRSIYPGVCVAISDLSLQVREVYSCCKFKKSEGAITRTGV